MASFHLISRQLSAACDFDCGQVGERGSCPLTEVTHVLRPTERVYGRNDGQGATRELLYHLATGASAPRIGVEPMTDNPMSSAHQKSLRAGLKQRARKRLWNCPVC